jgi:uroporphyrinogen III methyltransferase/synthase
MKAGRVYLVGAGPGSTDLITFKGLRCLSQAGVLVYDHLVNPKLLQYLPKTAEVIYAGKFPKKSIFSQDKINALLVKKAREGKIVVRLKGGDPFLFGRGAEEALFLAKHKIPFEVVPGISSAMAVPCYAGIPLTHRNYTSSVGIFTGHEDILKKTSAIDWQKISTGFGTLVFLMGAGNISEIVKNLIKFGREKSTPCCLIQDGTLPMQRTLLTNLGTIIKKAKEENFRPPAILVVGKIVSLRERLNWFEKKPLFGKKILVTVPSEDKVRLSKMLEEQGASCIELPVVRIEPLSDYSTLEQTIKEIEKFHWLIFTSGNGVRFFKERLEFLKKDVRILKGIKVAAIGPKTKLAVEELGLKIDIEPKEFCQEGLIKAFKKIDLKGKAMLIVRALEARDVLPQDLKNMGAYVTVISAYKTAIEKRRGDSAKILDKLDLVTFTSSSCVQGFFRVFSKKLISKKRNKFRIASIGPITTQTAGRLGLKVDIEAANYTLEGLVEAIVEYYQR